MNKQTMNMEMLNLCVRFLEKYYKDEIAELAQRYPREQRSLEVDYMDLLSFNPGLADDYESKPKAVSEYLDAALSEVDLPIPTTFDQAQVRITNLDPNRGALTRFPGEFTDRDIGKARNLTGQITQVSQALPELIEGAFECQRCGTMTYIPQGGSEAQQPHECQGCERQGPFKLNEEESTWEMSRKIRVQLPPEEATGASDTHVDVRLTGDLAEDKIQGAQRVSIPGYPTLDTDDLDTRTFDFSYEGKSVESEDGIDNVDYEEHEEEIQEILQTDDPIQTVCDSIVPHLSKDQDLETIVKACLVQAVGTTRKDPSNGPTYRGDSHILVLGDPSTGKSDIVQEMTEIAPRGKYKSGKGLSKTGMTAAAVKDDEFGTNGFILKAGLLVLASGGLAGVDEIDKVKPDAIAATHSALENQVVTTMKAGIDANLPARTALLASGNPKYGRFDPYKAVSEQIDLPPSLMSRFDLMFMLRDQPEEARDEEIADHMVTSWMETAEMAHPDRPDPEESVAARRFEKDVLTAYIGKARTEISPRWENKSVADKLKTEYVALRSAAYNTEKPVPVTARQLQALLRLSEACARARHSNIVEAKDVDLAVSLVEKSLNDVGVDPETGEYDADVIESGMPKTQRDRIDTIRDIIRELEGEHEAGAPLGLIHAEAEAVDIDREKADHVIDKLKEQGEAYGTADDHLRLTE